MRYADDFLEYFAKNFNEDIFINFRDGLFYATSATDLGDTDYINLATGQIQQSQPQGTVWMTVKILRQPVRASSIGNGNDVLKDEGFIFNCRIFTPRGQSNKKAYEIESVLDNTFDFESIPAGNARIYTEKDILKIPDEPFSTSESVWSELRLSYRFFARYF